MQVASCNLPLQLQFASAATPQLQLQLGQQTFQCGNVLDMHA